jgi:hypothetical protein
MMSGTRHSEGRDRLRTGSTVYRRRTEGSVVTVENTGGGWKGSDQKVYDAPRARGSGSFGREAVSSLGSSKGYDATAQRWGGSGRRQTFPAPQSRVRGAGENGSSSNSRTGGVKKGSYSNRAVSDNMQNMLGQPERSRHVRSGWAGRSASDASVAGSISSKKHKLRRPVMTYDRAGRR